MFRKKRDDQNDDDYLKSVIELMFKNLDKEVKMYSRDQNVLISENQPDAYSGTCYKVLAESFGFIKQKPDYWQTFPNMYIFKVVLGFISVISWVGIGYFVAAIQEKKPKLESFANIIAGVFDTAFIISLFFGAPLFSVPMIAAAMVSFVLRIVFAILIGKNIAENKKSIKYNNEIFFPTLREIFNYLSSNKPEEKKHEIDEIIPQIDIGKTTEMIKSKNKGEKINNMNRKTIK